MKSNKQPKHVAYTINSMLELGRIFILI